LDQEHTFDQRDQGKACRKRMAEKNLGKPRSRRLTGAKHDQVAVDP
jgi:hypothetical protein